jgi:hypothetical protein
MTAQHILVCHLEWKPICHSNRILKLRAVNRTLSSINQ